MKSLFGKVNKAFSSGGCSAYRVGDSMVWLIDAGSLSARDVPFGFLSSLICIDSHLADRESFNSVSKMADRIVCSGAPGRTGDWWYDWSRSSRLFKYDADAITERWPDQSMSVLPDSDPEYGRLMRCDDDSLEGSLLPFGSFCRQRLFVRTDKTNVFLSPVQQAQAAAQHGTPVVSFELSRLQRRYRAIKRLTVAQGKKPWYLLLKYRRGGFTTLEQAENYALCVQRSRSYVAALADTNDKMRRIFRIAKTYQEHDPRAPRLVSDSKTQLELANGSLYFIGTAGSSGFARGDTLQRVHGSEISKWCHGDQDRVEEVMAGILGACEHGTVVLETTANGVEWFASKYREAKRGENDFTPIFLRWFDDPTNRLVVDKEMILDTLTDEENRLRDLHGLDHEQIAFRRDRKRGFGKLFAQEYPEDDESCFIVSGTPYFDNETLMTLMEVMPPDKDGLPHGAKSIPGGYEVRWAERIPGVKYVVGADTSEGIPGRDKSGLGVMRKDTGEQVAEVHGYFSPRVLADHLCRFSREYNDALLGIERENHGHAVIQKVIDLGIHQPHFKGGSLYYHSKANARGRDRVKKAGWTTNSVTRPVMLEDLSNYIDDAPEMIRSREFLSECITFRLQRNGRFEADPGCHDDRVMKWAVANQMRIARINKPGFIG
jgi:hypothetical protein